MCCGKQPDNYSHWNRAGRLRVGVEIQLHSFFKVGARWRWLVNAMTRPLYFQERDPVPIYRKLGGPKYLSRQVQKISPPTGI